MSKVKLATSIGSIEVTAIYTSGPFALHESFESIEKEYRVAHIPTGMAFPMYVDKLSFGRAFIDLLNSLGADWNIKDPKRVVEVFMKLSQQRAEGKAKK